MRDINECGIANCGKNEAKSENIYLNVMKNWFKISFVSEIMSREK